MEKPKILYVDDEKDNLFIFSVAFRHHYHVLTALSGEEALVRFADNPDVAVVVADQRMPGMTGVELLSRIRERDPEVVRVILTAYTDVPDIIEAINRGQIYHYAVKPWVEQDLLHLLTKAVETHRLLRENRRLLTELAEKNRLLEADIGKRKRMETILLRRDMILAAVTGMASSLLLDGDWRVNIEGLIGRMALVLGVSRVHILRNTTGADGAVVLIPQFRWISSDGLSPEGASRLAPIVHRSDDFACFREILATGDMVRGNVGDFAETEVRELLRRYHIRSIALAPIMVNNAYWGGYLLCRLSAGKGVAGAGAGRPEDRGDPHRQRHCPGKGGGEPGGPAGPARPRRPPQRPRRDGLRHRPRDSPAPHRHQPRRRDLQGLFRPARSELSGGGGGGGDSPACQEDHRDHQQHALLFPRLLRRMAQGGAQLAAV